MINIEIYSQVKELEPELMELVQRELDFSHSSVQKGTKEAFLEFLAEKSIIFAPEPVDGKDFWETRQSSPGVLSWYPDFADISADGKLGFTTGPYEFRNRHPLEKPIAFGNFVTIWKKDTGKWKVILDMGSVNSKPEKKNTLLRKSTHVFYDKMNIPFQYNDPTEIRKLEDEINFFYNKENYYSLLSEDIKIIRMFHPPAFGYNEAIKMLENDPVKSGKLIGVEVNGGLGYSYGSFSQKASLESKPKDGYYLRIWKVEDNAWKIILEFYKINEKEAY